MLKVLLRGWYGLRFTKQTVETSTNLKFRAFLKIQEN